MVNQTELESISEAVEVHEEELRLQRIRLEIQERKGQIFAQKCKVAVSIFLLILSGVYVVAIPLLSQGLRVYAIMNKLPIPPRDWGDWLNEFACAVGILSILAWGFTSVIPILQIMKSKQPKIDLDLASEDD